MGGFHTYVLRHVALRLTALICVQLLIKKLRVIKSRRFAAEGLQFVACIITVDLMAAATIFCGASKYGYESRI